MGLFCYNKIGSIIPMVVLPTTEIIEPEKLTSRENLIGFLFLYVQSDENTLLKVDKVFKPNSNRLMFLVNLLVASSFAL